MRTKTVLMSAFCGLISVAAVNAQSVYSVNAVGYVNTTFAANSFKMFTNPLNGSNTLATLFPNLTDADQGCMIYQWVPASSGYATYVYLGLATGWLNNDTAADANSVTLTPGQGAWFYAVNNTTVTFVGQVVQGSLSNPIAQGWTQIGN